MPSVLIVGADAARYFELLQARQLPSAQLSCLPDASTPSSDCGEVEVILGPPDAVAALLPHCPDVRWAQSSWAGVTPLVESGRQNYQLTGLKGVFGEVMSEYVLGWLLAFERNILERARSMVWDNKSDPGLAGKTLGVMGTGSIGQAVATAVQAFGVSVRGLNSSGKAVAPFEACYATDDALEFAQGLDFLLALLPDLPATTGLVNAQLLNALRPGAIFINAGRANCVDDDAVISALEDRRLRAAVLDVVHTEPLPANDRLWQVENLYITSHTAAPTPDAAVIEVFADNYHRYIAGEPLQHVIDFARGY